MGFVRVLIFLVGLFFLAFGMTLLWGFPGVGGFWLQSYFMGAVFIGYAIATLWIAVTKTYRALVGAGISGIVTFGGCALYILRLARFQEGYFRAGEVALYLAVLSIWLLFLGQKFSKKKKDRLPLSVQCLFGLVFTIALLEGVYLVIPLPFHFAWVLPSEYAVIYGWLLIGGSLFYAWGLIQPIWENGYPQLYALLAYDLLVIGPLLTLFREGLPVAVVPFFLWSALATVVISVIWVLFELSRRFFFRKGVSQ